MQMNDPSHIVIGAKGALKRFLDARASGCPAEKLKILAAEAATEGESGAGDHRRGATKSSGVVIQFDEWRKTNG